jgi:hypothetical protein
MSTERSELNRIRRSPAAAKEIVEEFLTKRHRKAVLKCIAQSIKVAHAASSSKWGVRLNRNSVMLKVGFVEVLQFGEGWFHLLALGDNVPEHVRKRPRIKVSPPPYVNAPGCETCDMPFPEALESYPSLRTAHEAAIQVVARSRRHTTTTKDHSPGFIVYLAEVLGTHLPQPEYLEGSHDASYNIPEEIPADEEFLEGSVTQVLVNRYERDRDARTRCIQHYGPICAACGNAMSDIYGSSVHGLIHIHHLTPISSSGEPRSVDPIKDLCPVCPNCHAVIHTTRPPRSIEEVQEMLRKQRGAQRLM